MEKGRLIGVSIVNVHDNLLPCADKDKIGLIYQRLRLIRCKNFRIWYLETVLKHRLLPEGMIGHASVEETVYYRPLRL